MVTRQQISRDSRAVCLVVVVGDPKVLARHPEWRELIQYCQQNQSYVSNTDLKEISPNLNDENFPVLGSKPQKVKAPVKQSVDLFSEFFLCSI
jgi:hypothetical protein